MEQKHFHHALKIDHDICIGCAHCMMKCPTEAIRIRGGKSILYPNRCVDCGECFKACPVSAIFIDQDDYNQIKNYTHRIALVPSVFFGQFPKEIPHEEIVNAIKANGFTDIYEVETSVELLSEKINAYVKKAEKKPVISSFCPAIVRLIQVKFPSLTENILLLKPPLDTTALYCRKKLVDNHINPAEIGVFYITPCAAKIAAVKSPVGEDFSVITGVINMDTLYNKVYGYIKNNKNQFAEVEWNDQLTEKAFRWMLTNGEAKHIQGRCLAIDEIHNVIRFLERVENDELKDVDYLELRACDQSCTGGVLLTNNRFLTTERMKTTKINTQPDTSAGNINEYRSYLEKRIVLQEVKPRSMLSLDENMEEAMRKLELSSQALSILPLVDCGICGSPSCQAFATDIAQGEAELQQCIFIQKDKEIKGQISPKKSVEIMKKIWGKEKFNPDIEKS